MIRRITTLVGTFAVLSAAVVGASEALVSTEWLSENLDRSDVAVVEVSVNPGVYERGHIDGAVNFRWHTDLVAEVQRDIVSREGFEQLLSEAGISNDDTVVLYGDTNNWFAAWGAWIFDVYGHDDFRLLDGGRAKWEAEGRNLTTAAPDPQPTDYEVTKVNEDLRALRDDVVAVAEGEAVADLVDIRSNAEYRGEIIAPQGVRELSVRAGHVPGAVNVRNYDGSWTEYGNSVGVPVANPAGTVWDGQ